MGLQGAPLAYALSQLTTATLLAGWIANKILLGQSAVAAVEAARNAAAAAAEEVDESDESEAEVEPPAPKQALQLARTWPGWQPKAMLDGAAWWRYLSLGLPAAAMICIEW